MIETMSYKFAIYVLKMCLDKKERRYSLSVNVITMSAMFAQLDYE